MVVSTSSGVLKYDRQGTFLNRIGRKGRGPGEYIYCVKTDFDFVTKAIFVLNSNGSNSVIKYDLEGNYIDEIKIVPPIDTIQFKKHLIGNFFSSFVVCSNELIFFSHNAYGFIPNSWVWTDLKGNVLDKKKNFVPEFNLHGLYICSGEPYKLNGKLFFWEFYNDTVFEINNNSYHPVYLFGRDKYRLTPDISSNLTAKFEFDKNVYIDYMSPKTMFEIPGQLFIEFFLSGKKYWSICNKNTWIWNYCSAGSKDEKNGFTNDLDGGVRFNPSFIKNIDHAKYLIDYVDAYQLKAHVASDAFKNSTPKYPEKKKELEKLADSLDENDNPVLMLVKLKD